MGIEIIPELISVFGAAWASIKALHAVGDSDVFQNNLADLRLKAQGHFWPMLVERLDDGSDPAHQILHLDMAPKFPQERIDLALLYWPAQTTENVVKAMWREVAKRAFQDRVQGEEQEIVLTLDAFRGSSRMTWVIRGQVGGDCRTIHGSRKSSLRKLFIFAGENARMSREVRDEAKAKRKAANVH